MNDTKIYELLAEREQNETEIMVAFLKVIGKIYDVFADAGLDTSYIQAVVTDNNKLVFLMNGNNTEITSLLSEGHFAYVNVDTDNEYPAEEMIIQWCEEHKSPIDPHNFYEKCEALKHCGGFKKWEEILLYETRRNDIPVKGKMPTMNGNFEYTGEYDTFALDGKRYRIKVGQDVYLNGQNKTWVGGSFVNW